MDVGRTWIRWLPLASVIHTGCPGGSGDDEIGDATGDDGPPIPQDPLDDDGAEPPGEPDEEAQYPSPSTLGNGLVHDTRYLLGVNADVVAVLESSLDDGVPWDLEDHQTMLAVGF